MNKDIKLKAAGNGVKQWQIAQELGVSDSSFCKKLRNELSAEEKEKIFDIIERLKNA